MFQAGAPASSPIPRPLVSSDCQVSSPVPTLLGRKAHLGGDPENLVVIGNQRLEHPLLLADATDVTLERVQDVLQTIMDIHET